MGNPTRLYVYSRQFKVQLFPLSLDQGKHKTNVPVIVKYNRCETDAISRHSYAYRLFNNVFYGITFVVQKCPLSPAGGAIEILETRGEVRRCSFVICVTLKQRAVWPLWTWPHAKNISHTVTVSHAATASLCFLVRHTFSC